MPRGKLRDTDLISLGREIRELLAESVRAEGTCLIVISPHLRSLRVRLRAGHHYEKGHVAMSIVRIAWALANPHDHLTKDECAVHICENTGEDGRPLCANGAHLRKGSREDAQHAKALRRKGFFKEAA